MPLDKGSRLGAFEILGLIGAGGMGEVYRARDTRLDRDVAIKVLPESIVHDPDRLARFEREARVLAALNHSLIAHVYGLEESGRTRAIVMELVEGPTLEERIAQGAIPVPETLQIARQLAEALESAHELGIIHRDLKPANIKVTPNDAVKVLDFGLAKALDSVAGASGDALNSPTLTNRATEIGIILGTAAYMAPEQARGKAVDRRADVWAFGVVCVEMLTGQRLFKGEDISDTMAAVLRQPIDLSALPPATPRAVRTLLERCLERDPRQRLRDIGEARVALERAIAGPAADEAAERAAAPVTSPARRWLPWILFAATALALAATLGRWLRTDPAAVVVSLPAPVTRVVSSIGVPGSLAVDAGPAVVLSPDGRTMVLRVRNDNTARLYVRRLDELQATELPGTEDATNPFFSPDGSQVGFFAAKGLKTMPVAGGAIATLTDAGTGRGAVWAANGDITFQSSLMPQSPLSRVNAAGVKTERALTLGSDETTHRWPTILPNGKLLYSGNIDVSGWDNGTVRVEGDSGVPGKVVLKGGYHAHYVPTGHLLYVHAGTLYGVRFDLDRLEQTSPPAAIVDKILSSAGTGGAQYSIGSDGTLAYVPGSTAGVDSRLYWMSVDGKTSALKITPGSWGNPRFSPNGDQIALQVAYGSHDQIAVYDWKSERVTQLTFDAANHRFPAWTPDGQRIVYTSDEGGAANLFWRRADGSGAAARLTTSASTQSNPSVHKSGRSILFVENSKSTRADLFTSSRWREVRGQGGRPARLGRSSPRRHSKRLGPYRPMGGSSPTCRASRARSRSLSGRSRAKAGHGAYRPPAARIRCGRRPRMS